MSILQSIRRIPIPFDREKGDELAQSWGAQGDLADILKGIGGCSPFLFDVLGREGDWIKPALDVEDPCALAMNVVTGPQDLRQAKRRIAGLLAIAEVTGAWPLQQTTSALTDFADFAVETALDAALAPFKARGKIPDDVPIFVIAMGKMGAGELNYSSDIDLIVMFDDMDMDPYLSATIRPFLIKAVRAAMKTLSDVTADGYVFRTDLRLRPDPSVTPICVGTRSAMTYYEGLGRTWERAAFIKARICAGDKRAGAAFLKGLTPFVWRKHLDFAAIEEAHDLRLKIRANKTTGRDFQLPGYDIKLGRGGIREIEFFTQTRQLISGGRDPSLRSCRTLEGLNALQAAGWIDANVVTTLETHYTSHRHTEHCLQMLRDTQTQSLPHAPDGMARIAGLQGVSLATFEARTQDALRQVHATIEPFFTGPSDVKTNEDITPSFGDAEFTLIAAWPDYPAFRTDRATQLLQRLQPQILAGLGKAADPSAALRDFDGFLKGLPAGVQLFSLFSANPKLIDLITAIAARAPALARYLGRNAKVLDGVLSGDFFEPFAQEQVLVDQLAQVLTPLTDLESAMDAARIWKKEHHFRVGVLLLNAVITPAEARDHYTRLARAVLKALIPFVQQQFEAKHGSLTGGSYVVIGMGSLGAGRLTSNSDLDLMLIFQADPDTASDGKRPLAPRQYFARLTQSIITALAAPTAHGTLYEVDMRLRPSGKSGPVATSLAGFEDYQMTQAWTWEHLALTQATPIFATGGLDTEFTAAQHRVLAAKGKTADVAAALLDMRVRLFDAKPSNGVWDLKNGPGGLQDMELYAQARALKMGQTLQQGADLFETDNLNAAYERMSDVRTCHILMCREDGSRWELGAGGWEVINSHCQIATEDQLHAQIDMLRSLAAGFIDEKVTL